MTSNDRDSTLAEVRSDLVQFEEILYKVVRGTYDPPYFPQDWADEMVKSDSLVNMRLVEDFFDRYKARQTYPIAILPALTYRIMDVKLQAYFVSKALPGLHNALFSKSGFSLTDPLSRPGLYVDHLCMMQALIGQVRILWERIMGFVYFLEEGHDIGKTIRKKFFKKLPSWDGKWNALAGCESQIDDYDRLYRTPEFHKNSILRASLFRDEAISPNDIMGPLANAINGFWQVLIANIEGVRSHIIDICPTFERDDGEPSVP